MLPAPRFASTRAIKKNNLKAYLFPSLSLPSIVREFRREIARHDEELFPLALARRRQSRLMMSLDVGKIDGIEAQ